MYRILVIWLCCAVPLISSAQQTFTKPDFASASYYGDLLIFSGFKLSAGWELSSKTKTKKRSGKSILKNTYLVPSLVNFGIKEGQKNWQLGADLERIRVHSKGRAYRLLQAGLYGNWTFNSGPTYVYDGTDVGEYYGTSRFYLVPDFAFGFGRKFGSLSKPIDLAAKFHAYGKLPYNSFFALPGFAVELRLKYSL